MGAPLSSMQISCLFLEDEEGVIGETDDGAETTHLVDGVLDHFAGLLAEDGEDLVEGVWPRASFSLHPVSFLGDEVHEDDLAIDVAGDDCIADAPDGGVLSHCSRVGTLRSEA